MLTTRASKISYLLIVVHNVVMWVSIFHISRSRGRAYTTWSSRTIIFMFSISSHFRATCKTCQHLLA